MTEFVLALAAVFIAAGSLLLIANHFGLPPVPFYILAGLITGTFVAQPDLIELALWGIAFLVFVFGSQVDLGDIRTVLRDGEVAAFTQVVVVAPIAFAIGFLLGDFFGIQDPFRNALYFSAAATLSSTLVGARILEEEIRNNLVHGRLAAAIHFFDDIVAIGALLVLSAEVLTDVELVTSKIGFGVLFILAGLLIYRHGSPVLIRAAGGVEELVLMGYISILIAFIAAAELVGISVVVGAFAAGIAVRSEGADVLNVRNGIESIKDFFAAIFFVTIGALVSIPTFGVLAFAIGLILLVVVINPLVYTIAFVLEGYDGRTGFLTGSGLNQVSELALVIAIQAWILGTIATAVFDAIILAAAVTMIFSAFAGRFERQVYERVLAPTLGRTAYTDAHSHIEEPLSDHVIVVGFGRQGRRLMQCLEEIDVPYVVIENDPALRADLETESEQYVFGDAMAKYTLERCYARDARLIVSTADYRPLSDVLLETETNAELILRADASAEAAELLDAGAMFVAVPSVLAADQLVENVERVLGDEAEVSTLKAEHREYLRGIEFSRRGTISRRI